MGTRILAGRRINEGDKEGAVFYNSTDGLSFGPVFDDADEAERFLSFLAGVEPSQLEWNAHNVSTGYSLYKLWIDTGRLAKRPVFQFSKSFLHKNESEHEECLDCDARSQLHREGKPHCHCGGVWDVKCEEDDGSEEWGMTCSFVEFCFPLFLGLKHGNNDVAGILKKAGVIGDAEVDPEHSCMYVYFKKGKKQGEQFIERLNGWLRDNWHRAYPESSV